MIDDVTQRINKVAFNVLKEVVTHCLYVNDIVQRGEHVGSCICGIDFSNHNHISL